VHLPFHKSNERFVTNRNRLCPLRFPTWFCSSAEMNDYQFKLVKIQGEFVWHKHDSTDEVFIVISGEMEISFRDGHVTLAKGEMYVVPKGVAHKPYAKNECEVLLIEPKGI
jgi:mannose-6-phosphate isomerase-like protein (cupin superfamily)